MSRRKRASLKDKGPEILGLTSKKGQGIDALFGGPAGETDSDTPAEPPAEEPDAPPPPVVEESQEETEAVAEPAAPAVDTPPEPVVEVPPEPAVEPPPAVPAAEAAQPAVEVDELGLPVAMETPPDDLEFSVPPAVETPVPPAPDMFETDDDLSGLLEEETPAVSPAEGTAEPVPPPMVGASSAEPAAPPAGTFPGEIPSPGPAPAVETPPPPPIPAAPASPPTPAPAPPAAPATVESLGGIITEKIQTVAEDILPADLAEHEPVDNILDLKERTQMEQDEAITARVARYVGRERREQLDREIEQLYDLVAKELSSNKEDAEFALRTLSEAQDIILEDVRQYDEALYRVAVVKTMLARKQNLRRWSYTYGMAVFGYSVLWLAGFIAGFLLTDTLGEMIGSTGQGLSTVTGAWFSALSGGIGGIIGIFYSLYWHVAMKQDFDRQYVMYYLVQPIMGFILGALVYFIVLAGFLFFNFSTPTESPETVTALGIVLGFIAGFRQRVVFEMIDRIVKKLLPRDPKESDSRPVSLIPGEPQE